MVKLNCDIRVDVRAREATCNAQGRRVEACKLGDDSDVLLGQWLIEPTNERLSCLRRHLLFWPQHAQALDEEERCTLRDWDLVLALSLPRALPGRSRRSSGLGEGTEERRLGAGAVAMMGAGTLVKRRSGPAPFVAPSSMCSCITC